jgi:hypothetical protein
MVPRDADVRQVDVLSAMHDDVVGQPADSPNEDHDDPMLAAVYGAADEETP